MREIALDTETTGLSPKQGHRVCEIACVEMVDRLPTGRAYHQYINPMRPMPAEALRVHGLTDEFLSEHPPFGRIAHQFLDFVGQDPLVAHNASFDLAFLSHELELMGRSAIAPSRMIDTMKMARAAHPGAPASLDALCVRFGISNSHRHLHGAMVDAHLLAAIYLELTGGRQRTLDVGVAVSDGAPALRRRLRPARPHHPTAEELLAHARFVSRLTNPIWYAV